MTYHERRIRRVDTCDKKLMDGSRLRPIQSLDTTQEKGSDRKTKSRPGLGDPYALFLNYMCYKTTFVVFSATLTMYIPCDILIVASEPR